MPYHNKDDRGHIRCQHQPTNYLSYSELIQNQDCQISHQASDQDQDTLFQVVRRHVDRSLHSCVQHPRQAQPDQDVDGVAPYCIGHRHVTVPLLGHNEAADRVWHAGPCGHHDQTHDNRRNLSQAPQAKSTVNGEVREPSDQQAHRNEQCPQPLLRIGQDLVQHPHHRLPIRLGILPFPCTLNMLARDVRHFPLRCACGLQVAESPILPRGRRLALTRREDVPQVTTGRDHTSHQISTTPLLRA
mmetsp:Transcript_32908/g.79319  ORF Transcript_32908/g.79319 Transcript_32908/m.79319 type:complete len:244 (-) Transcript_32908:848-1579(-)